MNQSFVQCTNRLVWILVLRGSNPQFTQNTSFPSSKKVKKPGVSPLCFFQINKVDIFLVVQTYMVANYIDVAVRLIDELDDDDGNYFIVKEFEHSEHEEINAALARFQSRCRSEPPYKLRRSA